MTTLFALCAVVGGTVLVCQFVLTVIGLGGDAEIHEPGDLETNTDLDPGDGHSSSLFFGMLSFRTLTAAAAFFGLSGLAADAAGFSVTQTLFVAALCGIGAIYGVHELMQLFTKLQSDGTVRLETAVGHEATVYLRVPARHQGQGKVHVILKNQTVEVRAETSGEEIPSGSTVRVTEYLGAELVAVAPLVTSAERSTVVQEPEVVSRQASFSA